MFRMAYFVSPHGFGHAARACAVMEEMANLRPNILFDIFTEVPRWFFAESLSGEFTYHRFPSDVGLVQKTPLVEDLDLTIDRLTEAQENENETIRKLARQLQKRECSMVVADISPLGLAAANAAMLPSTLVENFTWDWIYRSYPGAPPALVDHGRRISGYFASVGLRIQTEPVCAPFEGGIFVPPVARTPRTRPARVRETLGVPADDPMVVVSMGGVPWKHQGLSNLGLEDGPWVVVPGGSSAGLHRRGRLLLLPFHTEIYHPDLIAASDLVVSKLGYSTVAEAFSTGAGVLYLERPRFPESPMLARWVEEHMRAEKITEEDLLSGAWLAVAERLLGESRREPLQEGGAVLAARSILGKFGREPDSSQGCRTHPIPRPR